MQDFIIGKRYSAVIDAQGIRRATQDHFLNKLETMIVNTVLVGFSGDKFGL